MFENLAVLLASLVVLAKSSEIVIKNTTILARFLRVSELAIGFILIAVITSLPELLVSIFAAFENQTGILVGNVFGSNIANIALILGVGALIAKTPMKPIKKQSTTLAQILLATSLLPLVMLLGGFATRWFGIALLLIFVTFSYIILKQEFVLDRCRNHVTVRRALEAALLFFVAIFFVIASAHFLVDYATKFAEALGVTNTFIGATIVAIGTSLPELAVGLTAIKRGRNSIVFGEILGSCIINLTLVLGVGVVINPYTVANLATFFTLIAFALIVNSVINYFLQTQLTFKEGFVLLSIYVIFIAATLISETGGMAAVAGR